MDLYGSVHRFGYKSMYVLTWMFIHLFQIHATHLLLKICIILKNFSNFSELISPVPEIFSHCFYSNLSGNTEKINMHL